MNTNPSVDTWFAELDHPLKPAMQRVREILLGADPDMSELEQYGTIQFVYVSGMCSFVQGSVALDPLDPRGVAHYVGGQSAATRGR